MSRGRATIVSLAAGLGLLLAGCGDEDESASEAPTGYLPADAGIAVSVSTDLESDQWQALEDRLLAGPLAPDSFANILGGDFPAPTSLEGALRQGAALGGLDYDEDVAPLLGGDLVLGRTELGLLGSSQEPEGAFVAALDTGDGEAVKRILESLELSEQAEVDGAAVYADESGFSQVAVDGDVLVFAAGEDDNADVEAPPVPAPSLAAAIEEARSGEGLSPDAFAELDSVPEDALIRIHGDLTSLLDVPELTGLRELPWVAALEDFDAAMSFGEGEIAATGVLNTDPAGLDEVDLPLATAVDTPELVRIEGEIAGASANQSQTTAFLLAAVRAAFPESRFVTDVATLERELGLDFEEEFLRQFSGPSASSLPLGDEFSAVSTVADPEAMARTLRQVAPDLGRLIQDLQGLQGRGLIPLFLFAPDAPIAPGVLGGSRIEVSTIPGEPNLYRAAGLVPAGLAPATPLPEEVVFGLIGDVFVVASDERRAREIAEAPTEPAAEGLQGASIAIGDLAPLRDELEEVLGFDPGPLGELTASATATVESLRGTGRISVP